jgi:Carboxylesterase family
VNLALQDQAMAVRWVQDYISLFSGNPVGPITCFVCFMVTKLEQENITIVVSR